MKEIVESIDARIKSPLFGYFIFALIAINWAELFYLIFADTEATDRIDYFQVNTDWKSLFAYPLLTAIAYSLLYPWTNYFFMLAASEPKRKKNILQARSESWLLQAQAEETAARTALQEQKESEILSRARTDVEVAKIEDESVREKAEQEIQSSRAELSEIEESSVKMELAEAYIDMGDLEGAKELLNEVASMQKTPDLRAKWLDLSNLISHGITERNMKSR